MYQDLSTRLDFLLENMVEENYYKIKLHKFSIVDPITNLYSILRKLILLQQFEVLSC